MAYSFARSERNFRDVSAEKNEETLDVSQGKEIPDYLDLEFAWLNDYDNKGNYRPREHRDTSAENISKGDVLRRIRMTPRKNEISERRRTLSDDLSHTVENNTIGSTQNPYGWIALGPTKKISSLSSDVSRFEQNSKSKLRETVQSIYTGKTQKDNPYGWNALGPTRKKPSRASRRETSELRQTGKNDLRDTFKYGISSEREIENPYGWNALGPTRKKPSRASRREASELRQTGKTDLRDTFQYGISSEKQTENPYGWNALGPTRKKPSRASRREASELRQTGKNDLRDTFQYGISSETQTENPYGWNALGPTRKKPSRASRQKANELRQTGKNDLRDTFQYGISSETQTENPYGWNALGATRKTPSRASRREASELRQTGKNDLRQTGKNDLRDTFQYGISSETKTENPYGRNALGPTRKKPSRASRQKANELRQTGKNDLRQTGKNDLRDTFQYGTTSETQTENPYGWNALGPTRKKPSRVSRNKASELRQTGKNNLRDALHNSNATEFKKENPYGRKASGPTRRVHYITTVADVHAEAQGDNQLGETYTGNFAETTKENPYGWKALGRTRPPPEMSVTTDKDIRATRKRTYRESFAKSRKNMSGNYKADNSSSGIRKIIHAKRLEESARRKKNKASDQSNELRTTQGGRDLHVTGNEKRDIGTTVNDLRGTAQGVQALSLTESRSLRKGTYDYAYTRYIKSDTVQDPVIMIQEDVDKPERKPTKNLQLQRPLPTPSTQWRNIATDQHLMEKWHELFAKIKKKWSVTYNDPSFLSGASGDTSFIRSEYAERREQKRKKEKRFRRVLICVAVAVVLLVAIIIPVVIFTRPNDDRIS